MRIGDVIGRRFRIESELGREGNEIVWGAFDTELERRVAIHRFVADPDALRQTQRVRALETFVFDDETWLVSERRKRRRKRSLLVPIALATVFLGVATCGVVLAMYFGTPTPAKLDAPPIASASAPSAPEVFDAAPVVSAPSPSVAVAPRPASTVTAHHQSSGATNTFSEDIDAWFAVNKDGFTKCLRKGDCPPEARIDLSWSDKGDLAWVHPNRCVSTNAAQVCAQKIVDASHPLVRCNIRESGCRVELVIVAQ